MDGGNRPSQPKVRFYHELDADLWGNITTQLGRLGDSCASGSIATVQQLIEGIQSVQKIAARPIVMQAFAIAVGRMPDSSACQLSEFIGNVMACMASLARSLPELFPEGLNHLAAGQQSRRHLKRRQCAALLAAGMLSVMPPREDQNYSGTLDLPTFDFTFILQRDQEKCTCLLAYFVWLAQAHAQGNDAFLDEVVSFSRRVQPQTSVDEWRGLQLPLGPARVEAGAIEDSMGNLQADFANQYLGGGVLHGGNVQEEIRFAICPECLVGLLFCECMQENETIFIVGTRQYSLYAGYGASFHYTGPCFRPENGVPDCHGRVGPHIAAFDALMMPGDRQYGEPLILRELQKAYTACLGDLDEVEETRPEGFATGNWGCGVFGGDPQLKSLLQWLAASRAGRELVYFPFGDERVANLPEVIREIQDSKLSCGELYALLAQRRPRDNVFRDILEACKVE